MKQGIGITEQTKASYRRWGDAVVLQTGERWHGATYMAGYALECALKATLMREWNVQNLAALENTIQEKAGEKVEIFTQ